MGYRLHREAEPALETVEKQSFARWRIPGIAFDPAILRWNSSLGLGRVAPYIELRGGALRIPISLIGDASTFNFVVQDELAASLSTQSRKSNA